MDRLRKLNREIDDVTNALFDCDVSSQNQEANQLMIDAYMKVAEALDILLSERNDIKPK
jgi:hypothetical protein